MLPSSIEVLLAGLMPLSYLIEDFFFVATSTRKIVVEQFNDVPITQQGIVAPVAHLLPKHEDRCQGNQSHMVVPSPPDTNLVLGHAQLAFCLMKGVFDPEALALNIGVALPTL